MDSADAYAQPALLYCMSSAGMAKDHIHGHSTYYHVTIMLHHLFQLYILRLNIVAFFYLHARSLRDLARTSYYKPHHASYWTPSGLKFTWSFTSRLRVLKGCLPVLHKAPIYISDCD